MRAMFAVAILSILSACSPYPIRHVGMVHDYVFRAAERMCHEHGSELHYIVSIEDIYSETSGHISDFDDYPCSSVYKIRCQNSMLLKFNSGAAYCFITESQLRETLNEQ